MVKLSLFHEKDRVDVFPLGEYPLLIGRDPECQIHVNQIEVSWHHAKIYQQGNSWVVEDLNSTNGTTVNHLPVTSHTLYGGDRIQIGDYFLVFETNADSALDYSASESTIYSSDNDLQATVIDWNQAGDPRSPAPNKQLKTILNLLIAWVASTLPIFQWAPRYSKKDFQGDLAASITVTAMLIPQGMAYAMLAGLPPIHGLYASIAPPFIYALLGSSRQMSVGPVALDSLLVAAGIGAMAELGSDAFVALAILLAAMVGLIQILMGVARLGFVVNYLSYPVLTGFTTAAALIIGVSQLQHLLGLSLPQSHHIHSIVWSAIQHISDINPVTLGIGGGSIIVMTLLKRWNNKIPGAIIVVGISTCLVWLLDLQSYGVSIVGEVPRGLPQPGFPDFNSESIQNLLPLALTIALIGFTEAISVAKTFASKNQYRVNANQELVAVGMANVAGSLFKGYPVSGGISRSAVNAQAGAQTAAASMLTAVFIGITLLTLTPLFYYLPYAVLAAIIMTAVYGLIDTDEIRYLFKVKRSEGALLVLTVIATLAFGITQGLLAGITASIILFVSSNSKPNTAILGRLPGTDIFRNIKLYPEAMSIPGLIILRIDSSFYFANTEFLKDKFTEMVENYHGPLQAIILDAASINDLDSSADTALTEIVTELKKRDIPLYIAGVKGPVREVMKRSGLYDALGAERFFFTINAAIKRFESQRNRH